jgi:3-oxoacyl-[acyl-carrier protein] reductase
MQPIDAFLRTNLISAKAVSRHMAARRSGTILTLSTAASRFARPGNLGFGTTCASIEATTQRLAVELGPSGVRIVCLRPTAVEDAPARGSYKAEVFAPLAAQSVEEMLAQWGQDQTLLGRLPTLAQVADTAVFLASDGGGAITGAVIDLTCGNAVRAQQYGQALIGVLD